MFSLAGFHPVRSGIRPAHLNKLLRILHAALVQHEWAKGAAILSVILVKWKFIPKVAWQIGFMILTKGSSQHKAIMYFRVMLSLVRDVDLRQKMILELSFYLIREGNLREAYDNLIGFVHLSPYSENILYHGYCGVISYELWAQEVEHNCCRELLSLTARQTSSSGATTNQSSCNDGEGMGGLKGPMKFESVFGVKSLVNGKDKSKSPPLSNLSLWIWNYQCTFGDGDDYFEEDSVGGHNVDSLLCNYSSKAAVLEKQAVGHLKNAVGMDMGFSELFFLRYMELLMFRVRRFEVIQMPHTRVGNEKGGEAKLDGQEEDVSVVEDGWGKILSLFNASFPQAETEYYVVEVLAQLESAVGPMTPTEAVGRGECTFNVLKAWYMCLKFIFTVAVRRGGGMKGLEEQKSHYGHNLGGASMFVYGMVCVLSQLVYLDPTWDLLNDEIEYLMHGELFKNEEDEDFGPLRVAAKEAIRRLAVKIAIERTNAPQLQHQLSTWKRLRSTLDLCPGMTVFETGDEEWIMAYHIKPHWDKMKAHVKARIDKSVEASEMTDESCSDSLTCDEDEFDETQSIQCDLLITDKSLKDSCVKLSEEGTLFMEKLTCIALIRARGTRAEPSIFNSLFFEEFRNWLLNCKVKPSLTKDFEMAVSSLRYD
eukprot:Nk52_evm75s2118 gene=Nk52_evmTU75s2118